MNQESRAIIHKNAQYHDKHKGRLAPHIKQKAKEKQDEILQFIAYTIIEPKNKGQKNKYKNQRTENHKSLLSLSKFCDVYTKMS